MSRHEDVLGCGGKTPHIFSLGSTRALENFVHSPYYSESELCGGAVVVSFSKYPPWQAMHFLQHSTYFPKTCCRPLITSKFLASELPFHGWKTQKSHRARSELNSVFGLEKVDWRQCAAVMQTEEVTVTPSSGGGGNVVVAWSSSS
jgi:hypothetical protein